MIKTLVVGDCHVTNEQNLSRFKALGNYCVEKTPDNIIFIGDFLTLSCLSEWDRDKRKVMEGQRYALEIKSGNLALDLFFERIKHIRNYKPNIVYICGNHEDRLTRFLEKDPTFYGSISLENDLKLKERSITFIPYKKSIEIKGTVFIHVPIDVTGKPIRGVSITRKALQLYQKSCVFGHTHRLQIENFYRHGSSELQQVLNVGCFFEREEEYIKFSPTSYWKGLCLLNQYKNQRFDIETISLSRLKKGYL